ncbi:saccharopine dehydrogenase-like oxidoreductase isoform X1 [Schistocerca piceifrons]|uniref:saccharopine dehydrogenase-like oxidoreductase isoform X1 n=2 Tax=Schistocerca piceifrons TaxID=274613 RepID=UPI001F5F33F8|nr:saccharopine dehydrogenase-like oxidoreductase isoform X1 [Schistocerca piceifrons]
MSLLLLRSCGQHITLRSETVFGRLKQLQSVMKYGMSTEDRRLDLVVFGASGFTGRYAAEEAFRLSKDKNFTWGVAGRSATKLQQVLKDISKKTGADLSEVPVIEADVKDFESLLRLASRAHVIVNCVGPYRFYGEPVVKACIESGAHQVDVTGEPQYMERMQLDYNKSAEEKGVYIVSACGFDSIPADMGVVFLQDKFGGDVNSVEAYLESKLDCAPKGASIHYTTWESAVHGIANYGELRPLRQKLFPNRLPRFSPRMKRRVLPHKQTGVNGWCLPFPGSDRTVVYRSQRHFYEHDKKRPIQFEAYAVFPSLIVSFLVIMVAFVFGILTRFKLGVKLLLDYPKVFSCGFVSHEGPTEEMMKNTHFKFTLFAEGWKEKLSEPTDQHATPMNKKVTAQIKGQNPGYGATCTALILSAVTIIKEHDKMPFSGGVFTPGAAFAKTSLIEELNKHGLTFEITSTEEK